MVTIRVCVCGSDLSRYVILVCLHGHPRFEQSARLLDLLQFEATLCAFFSITYRKVAEAVGRVVFFLHEVLLLRGFHCMSVVVVLLGISVRTMMPNKRQRLATQKDKHQKTRFHCSSLQPVAWIFQLITFSPNGGARTHEPAEPTREQGRQGEQCVKIRVEPPQPHCIRRRAPCGCTMEVLRT